MSIETRAPKGNLRARGGAVGSFRGDRRVPRLCPDLTGARAGATNWVLVLIAALLLMGVGYLILSDPVEVGRSGAAPSPPAATESAPESSPDSSPEAGAVSPTKSAPAVAPESRKNLPTHGRIRGSLSLPPGVVVPATWELALVPSQFFDPGQAKERRLSFGCDQLEFDVDQLAFGSYDVRPLAEGMNSLAVPVELSAETPVVIVSVVLQPAGRLHGVLQYADGSPVEGVELHVARTPGHPTDLPVLRSTTTGADGSYEFEALPDGQYELTYGDTFNPLLKPEGLDFSAPSMHLPTRTLIGLGELTVEVVDFGGNPIPDVALQGAGDHGGTIDHFTGPDGTCRILGLPAGHFKLRTDHPGFATQREVFDIAASERAVLRLTLVE